MTKTKIEKVKIITPESGLSLDSLDVNPGDWVGFDNSDMDPPHPFLLARIGERGLVKNEWNRSRINNEIILRQVYGGPESKHYFLHVPEGIITFMSPNNQGGLRISNHTGWPENQLYSVEYAYSGNEAIIQALKERETIGFDLYANWFESEHDRLRERR